MSDESSPPQSNKPQAPSQLPSENSIAETTANRIKLIVVGSLLFVVIGIFTFPVWWYSLLFLLFENGLRGSPSSYRIWILGISYILTVSLIPFLIVCTILYLEPILLKQEILGILLTRSFNKLTEYICRKDRYIVLTLIGVLIFGLITLDSRSRAGRTSFEERVTETNITESPLAQPSRFIFLYVNVIDSLYKQREGDLTIAKLTEENQESTGIKTEGQLRDFLKAGTEQSEVLRKVIEYQAIKKTPEQQLKDLIGYLFDKGELPTYGLTATPRYVPNYYGFSNYGSQPYSRYPADPYYLSYPTREGPENERLDGAIQLIENYGLSVNPEKLERIRSRLLSKEIQNMESGLRTIQGEVLVVGNWLIESQDDFYVFRKSFIERVSDSPFCEFKLYKAAIIPESKSIISDAAISGKNNEIKLGIFGSVTSSLSDQSTKVSLDPIAVYLP